VSAADRDRPPNGSAAARPQTRDSEGRSRSCLLARDGQLLDEAGCALLLDRYELTMAASYLRRGLDGEVVFELSVRSLPPTRRWLLFAGLQPALGLILALRFGERELAYLRLLGYPEELLERLAGLRFAGSVEAIPEGTVVFAGEPLVRVRANRIEAQLLETILLNQVVFQTALATKAARVVLAAGGGEVGRGEAVLDFSPRRDHGVDAAQKAARSAYIAGAGGTSNLAAALAWDLPAVGTMAHSYVLSFPSELEAFTAFLEDNPRDAVLLIDTYDPLQGARNAIAASRATGVGLAGVRIDSGDLLALSRAVRALLDEAGMERALIVASGDLEELRIAELVRAGAPIDRFGVGTELGTSRDQPTLPGIYKLVAERLPSGWRAVAKRSPEKETVGGVKEVVRLEREGVALGDWVVEASQAERLLAQRAAGEVRRTLLVPYIRAGAVLRAETLAEIRARAAAELGRLPAALRDPTAEGPPYPVRVSAELKPQPV